MEVMVGNAFAMSNGECQFVIPEAEYHPHGRPRAMTALGALASGRRDAHQARLNEPRRLLRKPMSRIWRIRGKDHDLSKRGLIMGVLNVTPDSFSDGGKYFDLESAVAHGLEMVAQGANILDVGGESTRPGADPVDASEEIRRVVPAIQSLRAKTSALISVDTMKADVALAAITAGADIINDVTGFSDPAMIQAAAETGAGLIVMHMQGTPRTMQTHPEYEDVVRDVRDFFVRRLEKLAAAGIPPASVALDPGFGFGKTHEHNLALLRSFSRLRVNDGVLAVGVSRKSMIARLLQNTDPASRYWPTVALTSWLRDAGAEVIRVHDVKPNAEAMRMIEAIQNG